MTADFSLEFMQVRRYLNGLLMCWGRDRLGEREAEGLGKWGGRERERKCNLEF